MKPDGGKKLEVSFYAIVSDTLCRKSTDIPRWSLKVTHIVLLFHINKVTKVTKYNTVRSFPISWTRVHELFIFKKSINFWFVLGDKEASSVQRKSQVIKNLNKINNDQSY